MIKSIIVAKGKNNVIGKDNQLLWRLSADLKRFKAITMGHTIIMGRKTFESIGKALPGRKTIIITRNKDFQIDGCLSVSSIAEAYEKCKADTEVFVIGGAEIYKQTILDISKLYITEVDIDIDGDAFFPIVTHSEWNELSRESFTIDEKNEHDYSFINLERK